jgi:membrane-associated phospholipid phosphatase
VIDDIPKLFLALALAVVGFCTLWSMLDTWSAAAARVRSAWRRPALRRVVAGSLVILALTVIAEDVLEAEHDEWVLRLDTIVVRALVDPPVALRRAAVVMSHITGEGLVLVVTGVVVALVLGHRRRDAVILGAAAVGAWAASGLFKVLLLVPRPRAGDVLHLGASYGFPSGHALVTLVTLGTLAWLFARRRGWRHSALLVASWIIAICAGASRVVLAAHWPSDVAAGLGVGALWLIVLPVVVREPRAPSPAGVLAPVTPPP